MWALPLANRVARDRLVAVAVYACSLATLGLTFPLGEMPFLPEFVVVGAGVGVAYWFVSGLESLEPVGRWLKRGGGQAVIGAMVLVLATVAVVAIYAEISSAQAFNVAFGATVGLGPAVCLDAFLGDAR